MALYAISDLHLPIGVNKPMDIFGSKWINYVEKLEKNWRSIVGEEDLVMIPGDISWAMYLDDAIPDFAFIHSLPGKKIISKGNHDYWWTTMSKMNAFLTEHSFSSISFMQNNAFMYKGAAICATRGWSYLGNGEASDNDRKIYEREICRLKLSLDEAAKNNPEKIIAFLHYPPILSDRRETGFSAVLEEYGVDLCAYGHLHNAKRENIAEGEHNGVKYVLVSCDYCDFIPVKLCD